MNKYLSLLLFFIFISSSAVAGTLCSDKGNFFGIEIPEGFGADLQQAQTQKKCLLLYPLASSLKNSPHTLGIRLQDLKADLPLKEFIEKDLGNLTKKDKKARLETEPETTTPSGLVFEFRRVFNVSPAAAYAGYAYYQTQNTAQNLVQNQVLIVSAVTQKQDDISLYEPVYKGLVLQIKKLEVKDIFPYLKAQGKKDLDSPTARNFDLIFINSIRAAYLSAVKDCEGKPLQGLGIVRISQNGKIQNWFDEKTSENISCLGQKMLGVQGTKAPFEPFHILINSVSF